MNMMNSLLALTNLGPRPIGSPANQAAADFIRERFRSAGLEVEEQPYPCTAWEVGETLLELGDEKLEAIANPFSLSCDITAPLVYAGTQKELETVSAKGKFLLLYGDLTRAPLSPKSWFLKDERDERIIQRIEEIKPAAIIATATSTDYYGQLTEDWELDLPAVTVSPAAARQLIRHADTSIHLKVSAQRNPAQARNIVGRKAGREPRRIVLCAHFDSKFNTPGASDNAAGMAVLLGLAERLSKRDFRFGLEWVAFNGEEYLPIGDDEYIRQAESYFPEIVCAINMDGMGPMLGSTSLTALSVSESIEASLKQSLEDFPAVVWVDPWYESNHSTFAMRNIPALAISAVGTRNLAHQPYDDADGISPAKLEECAQLVESILGKLEATL